MFGDAVYENEYRKVNGKWMISKLHAYFVMYTDLAQGWGVRAWPSTRPEKDMPPDLPPTVVYDMYPGTITTPLHYENPVTGQPVYPQSKAPPPPATATLAELADTPGAARGCARHRIPAQRLQLLHGPLAMGRRGGPVRGRRHHRAGAARRLRRARTRVRAFLDLFGKQGLHQGELFDHAQYQPVVHVAADGLTAKARVRELAHGRAVPGRCLDRRRHLRERVREAGRRLEDQDAAPVHDVRGRPEARLGAGAAACRRHFTGIAA